MSNAGSVEKTGSSSGSDLASRMIDEALAWGHRQRRIKEGNKQAAREHEADLRNGQHKIRLLMALRSGYEKRVTDDAIDALAAVESQVAANGIWN